MVTALRTQNLFRSATGSAGDKLRDRLVLGDLLRQRGHLLDREVGSPVFAGRPSEVVVPGVEGNDITTVSAVEPDGMAPHSGGLTLKATVEGDAPVERDGPISPDDYFLRPDD